MRPHFLSDELACCTLAAANAESSLIAAVVATIVMIPFNVLLPRTFLYVNNFTTTASGGKTRRKLTRRKQVSAMFSKGRQLAVVPSDSTSGTSSARAQVFKLLWHDHRVCDITALLDNIESYK